MSNEMETLLTDARESRREATNLVQKMLAMDDIDSLTLLSKELVGKHQEAHDKMLAACSLAEKHLGLDLGSGAEIDDIKVQNRVG